MNEYAELGELYLDSSEPVENGAMVCCACVSSNSDLVACNASLLNIGIVQCVGLGCIIGLLLMGSLFRRME